MMMRAQTQAQCMVKHHRIDKRMCKHCIFGDKGNVLNGTPICINKIYRKKCAFE